MIPALGLVLVLLGGAIPASGGEVTTAEEDAQFELLMQRRMQKNNIPQSAAVAPVAAQPGVPAVPAAPVTPGNFVRDERARTVEFNKEFGAGAYEGILGFSERCKPSEGCNKLATADLIKSAYQFVDLRRDVEDKKVVPDSDAYRERHSEIKGGIRGTMNEFRPSRGIRPEAAADFIKFSEPIVKKVFTPEERLRFARRNAVSSDSAPLYTHLGETLNAAGPPAEARAAFDAALKRDPGSDAALSGRAEARLNMGDYSGAVADSRAALKLNPGNGRAFATLKFSEGRLPAGEAAGSSVGAAGNGAGGASPSAWTGPGSAGAADPVRTGGAASFDAARRSDALVADARRTLTLNDSGAAIKLLDKAVELNPSNAEALSLKAMAHIRLGNYAEALKAAEAGLTLAPGNGPLLDAKANALNYTKDYRGALAAADLAIAVNPHDAMAHYNRAWALGGLHDRAGAVESLRTAAGLNPQFAAVLDSALALPLESDVIYLFPGEKAGAARGASGVATGFKPTSWMVFAGIAALILAVMVLGARLRRA